MTRSAQRSHAHSITLVGAVLLLLGGLLWFRPLSVFLQLLSPDGGLDAQTAQFLDGAWMLVAAAGVLLVVLGLQPTARRIVDCAVSTAPESSPEIRLRDMHALWLVVLAAFVARIVVGVLGDPSLGDDGARNIWLSRWLQDPTFIRSGLWAPGHLYVQALVTLVVRDVERAGMLLAAASSAGCIALVGSAVWRLWGRFAALSGALLAALLPVSMAYGSISDVNPFFAFMILAAIAAVQKAVHSTNRRWLVLAWSCVAFASWTRFEAFLLVPAIALLLWPRWRSMIVFGVLCLLPTLFWNFLNYLSTGDPNRVYNAVRADTGLAISRVSAVFGLLAGAWQAVTLPLVVLGILGMLRALRARQGREWIGVLLSHVAALAAATVVSGTGNQARYLILSGVVLAFYSGVALGGMLTASRRAAAAVLLAALVGVAFLPAAYPDPSTLWIRRNERLRSVMDCVEEHVVSGHLVWISDEASFMFPSRTQFPLERFHQASRSDSDIGAIAAAVRDVDTLWVCRNASEIALRQTQELLAALHGTWTKGAEEIHCEDQVLFRLTREP